MVGAQLLMLGIAAGLVWPGPVRALDSMPAPPGVAPGDVERGREIVVNRNKGLCLLCHSGPFADPRQQGTIAPSLAGAGDRWTQSQLRLRISDGRSINPDSIMPSYGVSDPAPAVAARYRGQPILSSQQIEDVVAFLMTLKD